MIDRQSLSPAYIHRVNSAAQKALSTVELRRDWPHSEFGSPVVLMSLCAEISRLNIELQRARETAFASQGGKTP